MERSWSSFQRCRCRAGTVAQACCLQFWPVSEAGHVSSGVRILSRLQKMSRLAATRQPASSTKVQKLLSVFIGVLRQQLFAC